MNTIQPQVNLFIPFKITSTDADFKARLRMGTLVNFLIEAAIQSADSLGFGYKGLRKNQLYWVLSRLSVEIPGEIKWYDEIEVETWPKDIDGLHYIRDFNIRNKKGEIMVKASSAWLAIDLESKKIRGLDGELKDTLHRNKDQHALNYMPEKLRPAKEGSELERTAEYLDLDLNGHVTSSRYVDWMMNCFPIEFHEINYPKYLAVNFLKETFCGNKLRVTKQSTEDGEYQFTGKNIDRDSLSFHGKIIF